MAELGLQSRAPCEDCEAEAEASCACCNDDVRATSASATIQVVPLRRRLGGASSLLPSLVRSPGHNASERALLQAPKIDFHVHCATGDEEGLAALLRSNRAAGILQAVLLALRSLHATIEDVRRANDWVLSACARHASELIPFVTILESDIGAAAMLRDYSDRGARGLKLIGWTGACIRRYDYDLLGPTMRAVFATAEECALPVVLHLYLGFDDDAEAPEDSHNASYRDYLAELETLLSAHPRLVLVLAHFGLGFDEGRLPRLNALLARFPNLYLDTSLYGGAKVKWFGKASSRAGALADTVSRFPRQILFGTDNFGSRQRAEHVYRDAVRASCLHLACSRFSCPELLGAAAEPGEVLGSSASSAGGGRRSRAAALGRGAADNRMALKGLNLASTPDVLRALLFDNAARLLNAVRNSAA